MARQLSLFTAGLRPPAVTDLEGLLCGPAHLVQRTDGARLSVVVADAWRADALQADLAVLDLDGGVRSAVTGEGLSVRTPFDPRLLPLARRWTRGAHLAPPADLVLDGGRLRWWVIAAGVADPLGWLLKLNPVEPVWSAAGSALAAAGVSGAFLGPRGEGPAYRLTGKRRLSRLRELVGDPPASVPVEAWPPD
jgi:hypothetical protein